MAITKTNFMRGMQCPKMLWLDKHKPSLKVIPPEVQQRLDEGNEFGDKAMAMFGPYEEMTIYKPSTNYPDTRAMVEKGTSQTWYTYNLRSSIHGLQQLLCRRYLKKDRFRL